ncbi:hypothetical protein A3F29_00285 [Candidatus Roizmanbacteria bacterium RIFCSPHIGHO2_12_FULL_33_9]|uniref:Membrane protein 6-pyruvoyl-tetrahydropterin synthase-related domain-containing protein n=1 Tax=Candidatus Roizmanbacteria bacterium RIFCSPHIGHO2_12_FULL_33_9 TaxID=1802045 RepID=A0A1F7HGR2_9BACT|nr:MAG: hypothetical protein A3F29_00285 [Candidatus Roizmanbacteria bacterium RIFCSPHIGHO2_12_FULL_33_9]
MSWLLENKLNKIIFFAVAILFFLPALIGLFHSGFFLSDDGNWMVIRFSAFYEALRGGQFPVRFLPRLNNGYGYPVSDFLYPFFMYIGTPIKALGFSFVDTIKIIFWGSLIGSFIFTYLWLKKLFDQIPSLIGALAYTIFPYHLWDIYKRGSIGEALAFSIVPFILWFMEKRNLPLSSIGYGLLILSHNTLALLFLPVLFIYNLISYNKFDKVSFLNSITALILGLGLSVFFWFPAFYDRQFTVFSQTKISDFSRYFITEENLSLYGFIFIFVILVSLYLLLNKINKKVLFFLAIVLISFFFTISKSKIIWEYSFFPQLVQFPFRFISVSVLSSSFLIAFFINQLRGKPLFIWTFIVLVLISISAWGYLFPKNYQYFPDSFYSTNQDTTTVKNEYMPKWVKGYLKSYDKKTEIIKGDGEIKDMKVSGTNISFEAILNRESLIQINSVYFPGWKVSEKGEDKEILYEQNGLIRFDLPTGSHSIKASFGETKVRLISDFISAFSLFFLLFIFIRKKTIKI